MNSSPVTLIGSYQRCQAMARRHGTTYYWSTFALPRLVRHHVWALYAFCRYADDIVDDLGPAAPEARRDALSAFGDQFFAELDCGRSDDPVLKAVVHTVRAFAIEPACFQRFLRSMATDLSFSGFETWDDLLRYMDGSAAVVGEMMLPILEPASAHALPHARDLGFAFQLTNFLRDIGEDLTRNRIYLPREDLERFGVDPTARVVDDRWRALMNFEIDRCRRLYASADLGIAQLPNRSARCVSAARILYARILDEIESNGYDVFSRRARVATWRKVAVVGRVSLTGPALR